jgi:Ca2+-binding RTX toxin-like protein
VVARQLRDDTEPMKRSLALIVTAQLTWLFGLDATADAKPRPTCGGKTATIIGESRSQVITGTNHADVIVGGGGWDTIHGLGGNDVICGNAGADRLYGGAGNDRLYGNQDGFRNDPDHGLIKYGDILDGGAGNDVLRPGADQRDADDVSPEGITWEESPHAVRIDAKHGTATGYGHDTFRRTYTLLTGSRHNDVVVGSNGPDLLWGGRGNDRMYGRGGNDFIWSDEPTEVNRGGKDVVQGGPGNDEIEAVGGDDMLYGGTGNDFISDFGNSVDRIYGGAGKDDVTDELTDPGDAEVMSGGNGDRDRFHLFTNRINPSVDAATGTWNMQTGVLDYTLGSINVTIPARHFEELDLATYGTSWTVTGTAGANFVNAAGSTGTTFSVLGGDDVFSGGKGDDVFDGGPGTDRVIMMGPGDDTCTSVERFDLVLGQDCETIN